MVLSLLLACGGADPGPVDSVGHTAPSGTSGTTGSTGSTATTGTTDTGWTPPGPPLATSTDRFESCPDPYEYYATSTLTAASVGGGEVQVDYTGDVGGCGCSGTVQAWTEASGDIRLRIFAGDCDAVYCCEVTGTLYDVAPGTWSVETTRYPVASTTVTVP